MADKTEKATPKKLRDAKKKGQVAKSQDFPSAFTFIASLAITMWFVESLFEKLGGFVTSMFNYVPEITGPESLPALFYSAAQIIFTSSFPIMVMVSVVGILVNFVTTGPVFAPEIFKPDIKKFDPVQNLKAKFKMKTLFELGKSLFKIFGASFIIYLTVVDSLPVLTKAITLPILGTLKIFAYFLTDVIIKVGLFFITVAVADLIYQKHNFAKEMMMEKFEVKQEYKNTEGDPQIKGKRRQMAQEIAYQDGPAAGVRKAKAVVTNPTHLAIALGYERELDPAPFVIAKGNGLIAQLIVKEAEKHHVPIMRNIKLAHQLWEESDVYEYVPEHTYEAIAEVLRWVASLEENLDDETDLTVEE